MATSILGVVPDTEGSISIQNKKVVRSYKRSFLVLDDSIDSSATEDDVLNTIGLPRIGLDSHPSNARAICRTRGPANRHQKAWHLWTVQATYDTGDQGEKTEEDEEKDPVDLDPDIQWGGEELIVYRQIDLDNKRLVNSAGTPYADGIPVPKIISVVTVSRWQTDFNYETIAAYSGKTNETEWNGVEEGRALMGIITASPQRVEDYRLWRVTYPIKIMDDLPEKWKYRLLNIGPKKLVSGSLVNFTDAENQPTEGLLAADGTALGAMADPTYNDFRNLDPAEFNDLGIVL